MDGVAMEGPLPPLTKIDDDVEGVGVEVMLALKSMRCGRSWWGRVCEVSRFERDVVMGDSVDVARDRRRFDGLGETKICIPPRRRSTSVIVSNL